MNIKLNDSLFEQLLLKAGDSPRKRSHYNLHDELSDPVQRLCIGLKKGTYIRPHHHPKSNKWELMLALKGSICLLLFDETAKVIERLVLSPGESLCGIELKPNTWHTVFPVTEEAILMEVKEGPYTATIESDFASWAPAEDEMTAEAFVKWMQNARLGERYHQ